MFYTELCLFFSFFFLQIFLFTLVENYLPSLQTSTVLRDIQVKRISDQRSFPENLIVPGHIFFPNLHYVINYLIIP